MSAWYRSGTIAVAGKTVTGTGTNWTDNKMGIGPGQALLIPGAGTVKVYEIARVDSATQLTLTDDAGTVSAGQAYAIMSFYSDSVPDFARRLSAQLSYYQSQMDGWQEIMTGTGSITLEAPDGTQVTVSSLKKLTDDMAGKADKVNGAVPVNQGGTGSTDAAGARTNLGLKGAATRDVGKASGTVAAGDDSRLNTIDGKTGGAVTDAIYVKTINNNLGVVGGTIASTIQNTIGGTSTQFQMFSQLASGGQRYGFLRLYQDTSYKDWYFDYSGGVAYAPVGWSQASDRRVKDKITRIPEPLAKMRKISGNTWVRKDDQSKGAFGMGFIAQEVAEVFPEAVSYAREGCYTVDGKVIDKPLALSPGDVAAALHHESLLSLMDILKSALEVIAGSTSDTETRGKLSAIAALIPEAETEQKDSVVENQ